jgi:hypothetical protein
MLLFGDTTVFRNCVKIIIPLYFIVDLQKKLSQISKVRRGGSWLCQKLGAENV